MWTRRNQLPQAEYPELACGCLLGFPGTYKLVRRKPLEEFYPPSSAFNSSRVLAPGKGSLVVDMVGYLEYSSAFI